MARDILSDEDCADCLCRVCARNACNDSWNPKLEEPGDMGKSCECNCHIGDLNAVYETENDCPNFLPDVEDETDDAAAETKEAPQTGFTVTFPCAPGTIIYHVVDDCNFPSDCYTKQKCRGCEYRNVYVEKERFSFDLYDYKTGKMLPGYYLSEEEANVAKRIEGSINE